MRRKADELDSLKKTNAEKFFRKIPRKWQETDFKIIFPTNIIGIPRLVRDNKNFLVRVRSVGLKIFLVRVQSIPRISKFSWSASGRLFQKFSLGQLFQTDLVFGPWIPVSNR